MSIEGVLQLNEINLILSESEMEQNMYFQRKFVFAKNTFSPKVLGFKTSLLSERFSANWSEAISHSLTGRHTVSYYSSRFGEDSG